ncbi:MAG: PDZ domain-containing protein [Planctomycetota bacterium]
MNRKLLPLVLAGLLPASVPGCSSPAAAEPRLQLRALRELATAGVDVDDTRMLSQPACSAEHVAFVYAGDLWVAGLDGGGARRLTTHSGGERQPRFSPDGRWIAFTGEYDGNTDVFVVPTAGGEPRRLTWHPGEDLVQGFTPDGSAVLFTSARRAHARGTFELFTVPLDGGHPATLPISSAFKATFSPDGSKLAYTPLPESFRQWKNYRGGTTSRIWVYDVADHSVEQVPQPEGRCNDSDPMWIGDAVYFLSDRAGEFNLFGFTPGRRGVTQLTEHADFPIKGASAGGGRIAYEQAGYLHLYEPGGTSRRLRVGVAADLIETRPRYVSGVEHVRSGGISPTGKRAVFEYRGEIVTLPAEKGDPRNLTGSPGAHERSPAWSPDGGSIAFFSDASGEYELHVVSQDGRGEARVFPLSGAGFYEELGWSPDGERLSFVDNSWSLFVLELATGEVSKVAQEPRYGPIRTLHHDWSPDSGWIAYTLSTTAGIKRLWLYDVAGGESHAITEGLGDVAEPAFDAGGEYLYLTASTDAGPARTWFAMSNADIEVTNALYLVVLSSETPSPFAMESDEEDVDDERATEEAEGESEGEAEEDDSIRIDLAGIGQRIVALPLAPGHYSNLAAGAEGTLYCLKRGEAGPFGPEGPGSLTSFSLDGGEESTVQEGVDGFAVSADRAKMLIAAGGAFSIADVGQAGSPLDVDAIEVRIEPRSEWAQIYDEAWRINRDYFYDPGFHGADWPAMREKYAAFLPHLAVRSDLNRVIRWMCSELAVGHHYVYGGETLVEADSVAGGLLGADFEVAGDRYRFAKVFGGLNWNPDLRAPLTEPGVTVRAGDYLLAVDGRELRASENLYSRFENTAGRMVELTVGPNPDGSGSRTEKVVPIENELALRNRDWVEGNIRRVTEATDGRVAYVYVPNTAALGHLYFKRYFFPQSNREAIIVDERFNGGGLFADYYIDILRRPSISRWAMRYGDDLPTPLGAIQGPKVMLINELAGSGGDLLPWMFRKLELGTLVGRRTWGGLVGILGFPPLLDGGAITAPNFAFWTDEEGFGVENVGVPPDVEVEQLPAEVIAGRDPQLERAIEIALSQLEANPPAEPVRPPYPVRVRK